MLEAVLDDLGVNRLEWPDEDERHGHGADHDEREHGGHGEAAAGRPRGRRQPPHATKDAECATRRP